MGRYSNFDSEVKGQTSLEDIYEPPERLVAVSNVFAHARKSMSLAEQKCFVMALAQLDFTKADQPSAVKLDKKQLAQVLGFTSDSTDMSQHLWRAVKDLAKHSYIEIADTDRDIFDSGCVVTRITTRSHLDYIRVKFEEEFFPLFTGLTNKYITMWSMDIFRMQSIRSIQFYELLRQMSHDKYQVADGVYCFGWGVRAFKEMFDIPKDGKGSYMRENGGFDRFNFEKYVLEPLCEDLRQCRMINLIMQEDGKYYEKVKHGNRVDGYRFYWNFTAFPSVGTAEEMQKLTEATEKNPQILKVAKNIVEGKEKPKPQAKQKQANFTERGSGMNEDERTEYYNLLELMLLGIEFTDEQFARFTELEPRYR